MSGDAQEWWIDMLSSIRDYHDCQRYKCLPSELEGEDWHIITRHRAIEAAERRYLNKERKSKK